MTVLFTELNRVIFTALYRPFSTFHGIELTVNDHTIFYGLIPLSFTYTLCNRINSYHTVHLIRLNKIIPINLPLYLFSDRNIDVNLKFVNVLIYMFFLIEFQQASGSAIL